MCCSSLHDRAVSGDHRVTRVTTFEGAWEGNLYNILAIRVPSRLNVYGLMLVVVAAVSERGSLSNG